MELNISQLHQGENLFNFNSLNDDWMKEIITRVEKEGYKLLSPFKAELHLTKVEPDFYLKGNLDFQVEQTCARCAESFSLPVHHPFSVALAKVHHQKVKGSSKVRGKENEEEEELDVNFFEGNEIQLNPILEEQFFLSIPYQSLCKENCKGICQKCGTNLNILDCGCKTFAGLNPFSALEIGT